MWIRLNFYFLLNLGNLLVVLAEAVPDEYGLSPSLLKAMIEKV